MIRRDLLTGHWTPYIERAVTLKPCYEAGTNGGEVSHFLVFSPGETLSRAILHTYNFARQEISQFWTSKCLIWSLLPQNILRWLLKYFRIQLLERIMLHLRWFCFVSNTFILLCHVKMCTPGFQANSMFCDF